MRLASSSSRPAACRLGEDHPTSAPSPAFAGSRNEAPPFMVIPYPIANTGMAISRTSRPVSWEPTSSRGLLLAGMRRVHRAAVCNLVKPGRDPRDAYGQVLWLSCLLARLMVESGQVVTVNMFDTVFDRITWDCHGSRSARSGLFATLLPVRPALSQRSTISTRGLLVTTLVVARNSAGSYQLGHWPRPLAWRLECGLAGGGPAGR